MSAIRSDRVRTVFFGSGGFAVPILEALVDAPEIELVGVVTVPDRPSGRRAEPTPTPIAARARSLGLSLLQPQRIRDETAFGSIAALRPALGVLADYGRIVPAAILDLPAHGILNVHPSLLPRHRGASPIPAAILAGDPTTGVTLIRMDAGLDTGPIVAAVDWPLDGSETAASLETRAAIEGAGLLSATLRRWLDGTIEARPQDDASATLTRPLRRSDGRLDPEQPAVELARRVRAFVPWPGTHLETVVGPIKVLRAEAVPDATPSVDTPDAGPTVAGTIGPGPDLRLGTADGDLVLVEVQPGGGRPMSGEALLRGRPSLRGSRVSAAMAPGGDPASGGPPSRPGPEG